MKIELLYVADCPNHQPTVEIVQEVLREQGLPADITEIKISDAAQAAALSNCITLGSEIRVSTILIGFEKSVGSIGSHTLNT